MADIAFDRDELIRDACRWGRRWSTCEVCYFRRMLTAPRTSSPRDCHRIGEAKALCEEYRDELAARLASLAEAGLAGLAGAILDRSLGRMARGRLAACRAFDRPLDLTVSFPLGSESGREGVPVPSVN